MWIFQERTDLVITKVQQHWLQFYSVLKPKASPLERPFIAQSTMQILKGLAKSSRVNRPLVNRTGKSSCVNRPPTNRADQS